MKEDEQYTHIHIDDHEYDEFTDLVGLHEQASLNIRSFKLQYTVMFIFLLIVIFLTMRAYSTPYQYFIESVILVTAIMAFVYHIVKQFL
jgi:hypothetical protein